MIFKLVQQPLQSSKGLKFMAKVKLHTSLGSITLELDEQAAPQTVKNFLDYVKSGFYNGTIFHRVIKGFMIQGGGMEPDMQQKPGNPPIQNEAKTGLKNKKGTISMARTSAPHSASSQFFINVADNGFLDYQSETPNGFGYCAFGKVTDGMDVVMNISQAQTTRRAGHDDVPVEDVFLLGAEEID